MQGEDCRGGGREGETAAADLDAIAMPIPLARPASVAGPDGNGIALGK
eukprot:CAMPEP_0119310980 /NCGR_PEP_ID=MMETSP1333-20130426/21113_1 /TAXON_ID=418940 /ORGANISM="Scyphosphaera apsteinii, Strain RCC1455" /LENGTH=47 /DNA_ID= /DNA_START= /DNA_END= /DNA_ORIENTATION=